MYTDYTYGIEVECYLPEHTTTAQAAAAIAARGVPCVAETYNHITRNHWKIVTDGSLDDYSRGMELVSPVLTGEAGFTATTAAMQALSDFGCTVSKKCGLHVHVGVGDSAPMSLFRNLFKLYAYYEPVIDAFMPPSRRLSNNGYCRTVTNASLPAIDQASSLLDLIRLMHTSPDIEGERYHKLNLAAYRRHRTVEFRQHSGTVDANKAIQWTKFCLRMVDAAAHGRGNIAMAATTPVSNTAKSQSKTWLVGQLSRRPEGVTAQEALAATGWRQISVPPTLRACGLAYTTQRIGRTVRYFAQAAAASAATTPTLDGLLQTLDCETAERLYFRARTANLAGAVQWAA